MEARNEITMPRRHPVFHFGYALLLAAFVMPAAFCNKKSYAPVSLPPEKPVAMTGTLIPLAGNAFVVQKSAEATEEITKEGLQNWRSAGSMVAVYLRPGLAGDMNIGLRLKVPSGTSTIRISMGNSSFLVKAQNRQWENIPAGKLKITGAGYVKVLLQGVSKTGDSYAEVTDLIVNGSAVSGALVFANDSANFYWSRRGPSVHLNYTLPANTAIEWFYNEVTVPEGEDSPGAYFMSNGFGEGYFGFQVKENERWILFSVWDPPAGQGITEPLRIGEGVKAQRFGGEGTGGQSYLVYNWKAGTTYKFLTQAKPDGNGNTHYASWFYATEENKWRFLCQWKRPHTNTYLTNLHSFLENFYDFNGYMGRKAWYNNQWIKTRDGNWMPLTSAKFTCDATGKNKQRLDYAGGVAPNGAFYLQNGGFFNNTVPANQQFNRPTGGTSPMINFETLP